MKKFLSITLLIVAMLCTGATEMKAEDSDYAAHFYLIGNFTGNNWKSDQTTYLVSTSYNSETGKYYIAVDVTIGQEYYFALYNGAYQYGPETNGSAPNTKGGYNGSNSWKYTPTTDKVWICVDETSTSVNNNGYYPWVWVEEKGTAKQGDVNLDGKVDVADVTLLVKILLGESTGSHGETDINSDSETDTDDVTALVNIILGTSTVPTIDYGGSNKGDDTPKEAESKGGMWE